MPTHQTADAIVIGAGAVGCSIALSLSSKGINPTIIERDGVAFNASGYAWGVLSAHFGNGVPGPMTQHYRNAIAKHVEIYEQFSPVDEEDWGLQKVTSLSLADDETGAAQLAEDVAWMKSEGFNAEIIGDSEIYSFEPAIRPGMLAASIVNAGWELDSHGYTASISNQAQRQGATFVQGEVWALKTQGGRVGGAIFADDTHVDAPIVIAATGPWTSQIDGIPALPIKPIKGEILRLSRPGNDLQNRVGFNGFNVGRKPDGTVWAGTYEWDRGFNRNITDEGRRHILKGVTDYLPSLADAAIVKSTACLRPVASDGLPIVGASNATEGLYYANGAGKKGILLSPLMADWLSALIFDGVAPPNTVSSGRFRNI